MILDDILKNTRREVDARRRKTTEAELVRRIESQPGRHSTFKSALTGDGINIIAEVKKASPSKSVICTDFDPAAIARDYDTGGAAAVSVLTDEKYFQGRLDYLDTIASTVSLPLLRKDFIVHEYQIYEAAVHQASAVLLLAVSLSEREIRVFQALANSLGMDALVEVHNHFELDKALNADAAIIGVNNRDLNTFHVDLQTSLSLRRSIPEDKVTDSESGIFTRDHIEPLKAAGFDAFLIGESLMRHTDRIAALKQLRGV